MKINISKGWLPDYLPQNILEGGLVQCLNLRPYNEKYASFNSLYPYSSSAISGIPLSAIEMVIDGISYPIIGTSTKLYRLNFNKSLTELTNVDPYSVLDGQWQFVQYGNWCVATNYSDNIQVKEDVTDDNAFEDLSGTPPRCKFMLFNSGHLILGYLNEEGTVHPKKLTWSAHETITDFSQSLTTGADSQDLPNAVGDITGMANLSGEIFAIFHDNSITAGLYTGYPYTFTIIENKVQKIGAIPHTVISIGGLTYFWHDTNFYVMDSTFSPVTIGDGIYKTVLNMLDRNNLHRITSFHDSNNGIIYWSFPSTSSGGTPDYMLMFNYLAKRFTLAKIDNACLFKISVTAKDLDSLDTQFPSLDEIPYTMDSYYWQQHMNHMVCVNPSTNYVSSFEGTVLVSSMATKEIHGEGKFYYIDEVRPNIQRWVDTPTVTIGYRDSTLDSQSFSTQVELDDQGKGDVRVTSRFLQIIISAQNHNGIPLEIEADISEDSGR